MALNSQKVKVSKTFTEEEIEKLSAFMKWCVLEDSIETGKTAYKGECALGRYNAVCWSGTPRVSLNVLINHVNQYIC